MGKGPSFSTPGGVRSNGYSFKGGSSNTCPVGKKNIKPSLDRCKCCSGDVDYIGTTFIGNIFNVTPPASIKLL